jgi:hypothetical protein
MYFGRTLVDRDEVEVETLGLERFEKEELEEMGWKYIPLIELNLAGRDGSRPVYAIEQQLQIKTFSQELGYQRLNRIPGSGNW